MAAAMEFRPPKFAAALLGSGPPGLSVPEEILTKGSAVDQALVLARQVLSRSL